MLLNNQRASVGMQTPRADHGGQVRFVLGSLQWPLSVVGAATVVTCLLNGLCFHICWRFEFMQGTAVNDSQTSRDSRSSFSSESSFATSDVSASTPPAAYYGLCAAVAFEWVVSQYVLQLVVRGFVTPSLPHTQAQTMRACCAWFCVSSLPFLVCHIALYASGYAPRSDERTAPMWPSPHQRLFAVTMAVDVTFFALAVSYVWCDIAVHWLEKQVCREATRSRERRCLPK